MENKECFIVGGGPSLRGFDYGILKDKDVIAINQVIFKIPDAKFFITMDYTWLCKSGVDRNGSGPRKEFIRHPAKKYFILAFGGDRLECKDYYHYRDKHCNLDYDLTLFNKIIQVSHYGGLGFSFEDFRCGSDSGYSALQLAAILGYKTIYLLGLDFCVSEHRTHCHSDYPVRNPLEYQRKLKEYLLPYPNAVRILKENGVRVYSSSSISKLNQFLLFVDPRYLCEAFLL